MSVAGALDTIDGVIELTIAFDARGFDEATDAFVRGDVQRLLVGAVNKTAAKVQIALKVSMLQAFDRPRPFTLDGVKVYWATPRADGGAPSAMVFLAEEQAGYLDLELHGGTRRAGDIATTRLSPLVPGPKAPRDRFGGLPRKFVADALQDPAVAWVTLRKGEPPVLVRSHTARPFRAEAACERRAAIPAVVAEGLEVARSRRVAMRTPDPMQTLRSAKQRSAR